MHRTKLCSQGGWALEVEGVAVQTYICSGHFSATHGAGSQWATLEDLAHLSR